MPELSTNTIKKIARTHNVVSRRQSLWMPREQTGGGESKPSDTIAVRITEQDADNPARFAWRQEFRTETGWEEGPRFSTVDEFPCYTLDETSTEDLTDQHVFITRAAFRVNDSIVRRWIIVGSAGSESIGNFQGQKHSMVTDNQDGWRLSFFCPADSSLLP
jgi:hypothetical protein